MFNWTHAIETFEPMAASGIPSSSRYHLRIPGCSPVNARVIVQQDSPRALMPMSVTLLFECWHFGTGDLTARKSRESIVKLASVYHMLIKSVLFQQATITSPQVLVQEGQAIAIDDLMLLRDVQSLVR